MPRVIGWMMLGVLGVTLAGCTGSEEPVSTTPLKPTSPPPGYIEEKMKLREKGTQPGRPKDGPGASGPAKPEPGSTGK